MTATETKTPDPVSMIRRKRKITGISAILLPFAEDDRVDWASFDGHVTRTLESGLTPAVNMDTGYANLIDEATRLEVLRRTRQLADGRPFVAGVFVADRQGDALDLDGYRRGVREAVGEGATPILFQSFGLTSGGDDEIADAYERIAAECDRFLAFELGDMFAPFGKIYSLDLYRRLMGIGKCAGAKHSSLKRDLEWQRLAVRDEVRPEFQVLTGNDLAIDMVMYGSDYLLGLSTFAPDAFARRDAMWEAGDPRFYELNDLLQYLGAFAFRRPVPAYKHSAAMFLYARGRLSSPSTHPDAPRRPESDFTILETIASDLGRLLNESTP